MVDINKLFEKAQDLRNNGRIDQAIKLYQQVIGQALMKEEGFLAGESSHMIGVALYQDKRFEESVNYLLEAKEQFEKINRKDGLGATLRDLGMVYQNLGELEKAKDYFNNSIYYLKEAGSLGHAGISQVKLGKLYQEMGNLGRAEKEMREGLEKTEQSSERFFESAACFDLAKFLKEQGKLEEAKELVERSLQILDKISNKEQFQPRRKEIEEFLKDL